MYMQDNCVLIHSFPRPGASRAAERPARLPDSHPPPPAWHLVASMFLTSAHLLLFRLSFWTSTRKGIPLPVSGAADAVSSSSPRFLRLDAEANQNLILMPDRWKRTFKGARCLLRLSTAYIMRDRVVLMLGGGTHSHVFCRAAMVVWTRLQPPADLEVKLDMVWVSADSASWPRTATAAQAPTQVNANPHFEIAARDGKVRTMKGRWDIWCPWGHHCDKVNGDTDPCCR